MCQVLLAALLPYSCSHGSSAGLLVRSAIWLSDLRDAPTYRLEVDAIEGRN